MCTDGLYYIEKYVESSRFEEEILKIIYIFLFIRPHHTSLNFLINSTN